MGGGAFENMVLEVADDPLREREESWPRRGRKREGKGIGITEAYYNWIKRANGVPAPLTTATRRSDATRHKHNRKRHKVEDSPQGPRVCR